MPRFFALLFLLWLPACDTSVDPGNDLLPDTLDLSASAESVPAGEAVALTVRPGNGSGMGAATMLTFSLDAAGGEVAELVGPDGQRGTVVDVAYGTVQANGVTLQARPLTLSTAQPVTVTVTLGDAPSVRASLALTVTPNGTFFSGVNLTRLFAPPTAAELAAVRADWAARNPSVSGYRIEKQEETGAGARTLVVSHLVDGNRHYAAVRIPAASESPLPVVMIHHGGDGGADAVTYFDPALLGALRDDVILVLPSYRSEPLTALGQTYLSEGTPSPWDRDVDDAFALLSAVLQHIPEADAGRIAAVGLSRGADVALLHALRDDRVEGVVAFFGPTDFTLPSIQLLAQFVLGNFPVPLPGVPYLRDTMLFPLRDGQLSYEAARQELFRRSPAFFAAELPAVQIHHGTEDGVVPFEHGQRLADALQAVGHPDFTFFSYAGGDHDVGTLPGSTARASAFLAALLHLESVAL